MDQGGRATVVGAVIMGLCTVVAAIIGVRWGQEKGQATAFATATVHQSTAVAAALTMIRPTPQPTQTTQNEPQTARAIQPTKTVFSTQTATPFATSAPGQVLQNGQVWRVDGWSLKVDDFTYKPSIRPTFILKNETGRSVMLPGGSSIELTTDIGDEFPCKCYHPTIEQREISPTGELQWTVLFGRDNYSCACAYSTGWDTSYSSDARKLILTVKDVSGIIHDAVWEVEIPRP